MRNLVSVQEIKALSPIEGADMIRIRILTDAIILYLLMKRISIQHIIRKTQNFFTER